MRIVVKVGTSTLAYAAGRLNEGHEVILVSSGAIGMGVGKLSLPTRPKDTSTKQACAAVGQCELMYTYDRLFNAYNHTVAQILLTGVDVEHTERRVNFQNTLSRLLELGALPIINENDTVATDEITSIGDNDTLAAIVACCAQADLLVLLSDIDGLYTANPGCKAHPAGAGDHPCGDGTGRWRGLRPWHRRHGHQAARRPHGDRQRCRHGHCERCAPGTFV